MTHENQCGELDSIVALAYDECEASERRRIEEHVDRCRECARELEGIRNTREALAAWDVSESQTAIVQRLGNESRPWRVVTNKDATSESTTRGRLVPIWARAAAAVLVLGAAAAIARLEVRVGRDGLVVRTAWSQPGEPLGSTSSRDDDASQAGEPATVGRPPWQTDLAALERRLRTEFGAGSSAGTSARTVAVGSARATPVASEAQLLRRVRELIQESERRQQRELALRVAQVVREVEAQRLVDLARIQQGFGRIEGLTGVEAARQRELLNYLVRVSQRQ